MTYSALSCPTSASLTDACSGLVRQEADAPMTDGPRAGYSNDPPGAPAVTPAIASSSISNALVTQRGAFAASSAFLGAADHERATKRVRVTNEGTYVDEMVEWREAHAHLESL